MRGCNLDLLIKFITVNYNDYLKNADKETQEWHEYGQSRNKMSCGDAEKLRKDFPSLGFHKVTQRQLSYPKGYKF